MKQIKRYDKVLDLISEMGITYNIILQGDPLAKEEIYVKLFKALALQTIECGYFIKNYLMRGFCMFLTVSRYSYDLTDSTRSCASSESIESAD